MFGLIIAQPKTESGVSLIIPDSLHFRFPQRCDVSSPSVCCVCCQVGNPLRSNRCSLFPREEVGLRLATPGDGPDLAGFADASRSRL